jgi:hypothetical protein
MREMSRKLDNKKTVLEYALEYYRRGLCVIPSPYGKKAARIRWGKYQKSRPNEWQQRKWLSNSKRNIAVVLGEVSGNLACRDFDAIEGYRLWASAHPDLSNKLPTVKTANGYHVYFESHFQGIKHVEDGELRGSGGYCLLPPSVHPHGQVYQWVNPLLNGSLLAIDPKLAGFIPNVTEQTEKTEQTEQTEAIVGEGKKKEAVGKAIMETLPQEVGTRNRRIFEFARAIKSLPQFADAEPTQLREIVKVWHKKALPNVRTKEFEETWIDFLKAWPRIKYVKGKEPMAQMFEKVIQLEPPPIAVEKYPDNSKFKILVSLCRELQRAAGNEPFFLSVRTAGRLLNIMPMTASRWFFLLQSDGILKIVSKGGIAKTVREATRFRYVVG